MRIIRVIMPTASLFTNTYKSTLIFSDNSTIRYLTISCSSRPASPAHGIARGWIFLACLSDKFAPNESSPLAGSTLQGRSINLPSIDHYAVFLCNQSRIVAWLLSIHRILASACSTACWMVRVALASSSLCSLANSTSWKKKICDIISQLRADPRW